MNVGSAVARSIRAMVWSSSAMTQRYTPSNGSFTPSSISLFKNHIDRSLAKSDFWTFLDGLKTDSLFALLDHPLLPEQVPNELQVAKKPPQGEVDQGLPPHSRKGDDSGTHFFFSPQNSALLIFSLLIHSFPSR